jgi:hypothetical protein
MPRMAPYQSIRGIEGCATITGASDAAALRTTHIGANNATQPLASMRKTSNLLYLLVHGFAILMVRHRGNCAIDWFPFQGTSNIRLGKRGVSKRLVLMLRRVAQLWTLGT